MRLTRLRRPLLQSLATATLLAVTAGAEPIPALGDEAWQVRLRQFAHEPTPAALRVDELRSTPNGTLHKLVLTGARGRRVPGYVELPLHAEPPVPVVVVLHDLSRGKEHFWSFGQTTEGKLKDRLVGAGTAVVGLDLPLHGERAAENDFLDPAQLVRDDNLPRLRDLFVDAVIDHLRLIAVLGARADIDSTRIGLLGYGAGANVALAVAAVGGGDSPVVACVPHTVRDPFSVWSAPTYGARLRSPVLLLMAANSRTGSPQDGEQLRALLGSADVEYKVYTSDDRLPIWYVADTVTWLDARLAR
jgi:dienelactone hydrolase